MAATTVDVTGTLLCSDINSPFIDYLIPDGLAISNVGNQWTFAWETPRFTESDTRWSDEFDSDVGSYREQVEVDFGLRGGDPVLGFRFRYDRGLSSSGSRVDIYTLPDRLEQNVTGSSVNGGPFRWTLEGYDDLGAFDPALLEESNGLTFLSFTLEEGFTVRRVQAGNVIFTRDDAQFHECHLEFGFDDISEEFQDDFGQIGTDQPGPNITWNIGFRFE